jgi:molybdopterin synthase catalytic subunit
MYLLGVAGPADERAAAVDALAARIDGPVAVVRRGDPDPAETRTAVRVGDGCRVVRTAGADLDAALRELAPEHAWALLSGVEADAPTLALGGADAADVVERALDAASADLAAALAAARQHDPVETAASLVADAKRAAGSERAGAVATFTGRVRTLDDPADTTTERLEFERYDEVAAERMAALREDLETREGVLAVRLHHRVGVVPAGEDIVHVVVLAGHRGEAFRAVEDGIDRLKAEVPIFKREVTVEDAEWR